MNIRRAIEKDIPKVMQLLNQVLELHANIRPDIFISGTTKYTTEELAGILRDSSKPVYVAVDDRDECIGYAFCQLREQPFSENMIPFTSLFIDDLCVDETTRGQHIGESLFEYVKQEAKRMGCYEVTLNVWSGNSSAEKFYEKMGMQTKERQMEYILSQEKDIVLRKYSEQDIPEMVQLWNEIVEEGIAFPQEELLDEQTGKLFFAEQSYCGVAIMKDKIVGLYILHPNNVGRCGHICNASYAVDSSCRGQHIGGKLVKDCLAQAKKLKFGVLQFNAVVESNVHARHLYERLGFVSLGVIPNGFRMKDGSYQNICPYYHVL